MANVKFQKVYTMKIPTDLNEGRGGEYNEGYFAIKADAAKAGEGRGVMGAPAGVGELDVVWIDDLCYELKNANPIKMITDCVIRRNQFMDIVKIGDKVEIKQTKNSAVLREIVSQKIGVDKISFASCLKTITIDGSEPVLHIIQTKIF